MPNFYRVITLLSANEHHSWMPRKTKCIQSGPKCDTVL